jgi:hypothetical protein
MNIDYKFAVPTIISAIAAIFSILAYRRNRRLTNENHLFEKKVEIYSSILGELNQLLINLENHLSRFKFHSLQKTDFDKDFSTSLNNTADEIDEMSDKFRALCISSSLLLPESVFKTINILINKLYLSPTPNSDSKSIPNLSKYLDGNLDELLALSNQINQEMRKDLNIDDLNDLLYKRLKK